MNHGIFGGKGHEYCSGCGVCLLVCPIWRRTGSISFTRKARARALQGGATIEDIALSVDACILCGSCEPVCPEGIGLGAMNMEHRRRLNRTRTDHPHWYPDASAVKNRSSIRRPATPIIILADEYIKRAPDLCRNMIRALGGEKKTSVADDDGSDIADSVEAGLPVSGERTADFIRPLKHARTIIASSGILHRPLRKWLPRSRVIGVGEALLSSGGFRKKLGPGDMYVIESRGYHSDYERLVKLYDLLRKETGCSMNLDLHRIAVPTGAASLQAGEDVEAAGCLAQAEWILHGREVKRIVVEDPADIEVFRRVSSLEVVHVAGLSDA